MIEGSDDFSSSFVPKSLPASLVSSSSGTSFSAGLAAYAKAYDSSSSDFVGPPEPSSSRRRKSRGYVPPPKDVSSLETPSSPSEPSSSSSKSVNTSPSVSEGESILSSYLASSGSMRTTIDTGHGNRRVVDIDPETGLVVRERNLYGVDVDEPSSYSYTPPPVSESETSVTGDLLRFNRAYTPPVDPGDNLRFQSTTKDMNRDVTLGSLGFVLSLFRL